MIGYLIAAAYLGGFAVIWTMHWINPGNEWDESDCRFECCYVEAFTTSKHPGRRLITSLAYPIFLLIACCLELLSSTKIK